MHELAVMAQSIDEMKVNIAWITECFCSGVIIIKLKVVRVYFRSRVITPLPLGEGLLERLLLLLILQFNGGLVVLLSLEYSSLSYATCHRFKHGIIDEVFEVDIGSEDDVNLHDVG